MYNKYVAVDRPYKYAYLHLYDWTQSANWQLQNKFLTVGLMSNNLHRLKALEMSFRVQKLFM